MSKYLSDDALEKIYDKYQLSDEDAFAEYVAEAEGELETKLSKRFIVPLIDEHSLTFSGAKTHAKNVVVRALKLVISKVITIEEGANTAVNDNDSYYNIKSKRANEVIANLLDAEINFGFKLSDHAQDYNPSEVISIGRPETDFSVEY